MKRVLIFLLIVINLLLFCSANLGGVSPSYYEVDFEPFLERTFTFGYAFGQNEDLNYSITGLLSEYAEITDIKKIGDRRVVVVKLSLPSEIKIPGPHSIRIGARQIAKDTKGVFITGDVGGIIKVIVPYPGKYAELSLKTDYVNAGEDVPYELLVYSRGNEDILVNPSIKITDSSGELINSFTLDPKLIKSTEEYLYKGKLKTTDLKPGDYNLTATVEFGGEYPTSSTSLFRLGELRLEIKNHTTELPEEKVGRYFIEVESFWNDQIEDIYATFKINGYPDKTFKTPTISLNPWGINRLEGFVDTSNIESDTVKGEITVNYAGNKSTTKIVELKIVRGINWVLIVIIASIVIFIILILLVIFLLMKLKGKKK